MSTVSIAHKPRQRKWIDWQRYDALKAHGQSDDAIAPLLGMSQPGLSHRKKTRHLDDLTPPVNGDLPALVHPSASQRISALPVHYDASAVDDLRARVSTLEAFTAVLQASQRLSASPAHQSASAHPIASQRTEPPTWVSRGVHLAADMVEAIDAYAARYRLEKRQVVDRILHTFFAEVERGRTVGDA